MKTLDQLPVSLDIKTHESISVYRTYYRFHLFEKNGFDIAWHFIKMGSASKSSSQTKCALVIKNQRVSGEFFFRVESLEVATGSLGVAIIRSLQYKAHENH